jgi:hypothetical protein
MSEDTVRDSEEVTTELAGNVAASILELCTDLARWGGRQSDEATGRQIGRRQIGGRRSSVDGEGRADNELQSDLERLVSTVRSREHQRGWFVRDSED